MRIWKNLGKPKAGLIGAGGFAEWHIKVLGRLADEGRIDFAALADPRIREIAASTPSGRIKDTARLYTGHGDMLEREDLDLIAIATPPHLHFEMISDVLGKSQALVYLEKPPVPTVGQLDSLLGDGASERVAVGFQYLESPALQKLKGRIVGGDFGRILRIRASAAVPRNDAYYTRNSWAGRLSLQGNPVFDGPATNAVAHLVHNVMYFGGGGQDTFGVPEKVTGRFLRARPIESYDFAYMEGRLENGILFEIAVGHCSDVHLPWNVRIDGTDGCGEFHQQEILGDTNGTPEELLYQSYRNAIRFARGEIPRPTTRLADCRGHLQTVCGGFCASHGVRDIPAEEVTENGSGAERVYVCRRAVDFIGDLPDGTDEQRHSEMKSWMELPPLIDAASASRSGDLMGLLGALP